MRKRDEVLREFGLDGLPEWLETMGEAGKARATDADNVQRMASRIAQQEARIRELEAQLVSNPYTLAASEPMNVLNTAMTLEQADAYDAVTNGAASAEVIPKYLRDQWRAERGNGLTSAVGEYTPREFWELLDAYESLLAHPSAAGVTVTEAMVEAAAQALALSYRKLTQQSWESASETWREEYRADARVALTAALTAASEGASDAAVTPCEWKLDDPDFRLYHTNCGNDFELNEDGPVENGMAFCCYCGKPVKAKRTRPTTPTRGSDE